LQVLTQKFFFITKLKNLCKMHSLVVILVAVTNVVFIIQNENFR